MTDLRWGDVLVAAIDACCVVGVDETVCPDKLSQIITDLTEQSGGMDGVRGRVAVTGSTRRISKKESTDG